MTISSRIDISGTVNLILMDGCELTASLGIRVSSGNTLNIFAQSSGTGKLTISSPQAFCAGIGGNYNESAGTVNIYGGMITTTGRTYAAGIGGGDTGSSGTITIYGGSVTATGGRSAAGIGGGFH